MAARTTILALLDAMAIPAAATVSHQRRRSPKAAIGGTAITLFAATIPIVTTSTLSALALGQSRVDAWDIARGTVPVAASPFDNCLGRSNEFDSRDAFGSMFGRCEPGAVIFDDSRGQAGVVDTIEWSIPAPRSIGVFSVYRYDDSLFSCQCRGFNRLQLEVRDGLSWVLVYDQPVPVFPSPALIGLTTAAPPATSFRMSFTRASTVAGGAGSRVVEIDGDECTLIASPPMNRTACAGATCSFTVVAVGYGPFSYQWRRNGVPINPALNPTATSSSLTMADVRVADTGIIDCVVSSACNPSGVQSDPATLTICVADTDDGSGTGACDGGVTIDDLLYYLNIFEQGTLAADVDDGSATGTPDGGVTIDDLLYYLVRFEAGC